MENINYKEVTYLDGKYFILNLTNCPCQTVRLLDNVDKPTLEYEGIIMNDSDIIKHFNIDINKQTIIKHTNTFII